MSWSAPDFTQLIRESSARIQSWEEEKQQLPVPGPQASSSARAVVSSTAKVRALPDLSDPTAFAEAGKPSPWMTARETAQVTPERPEWLLEGYVARGAVTELTAKPKCGKTFFVLHAVAAMLAGTPFLGRATRHASCLYLTEELIPSFRSVLGRVGVLQSDEIHVLYHQRVQSLSWARTCELTLEKAREVDAGLVVCDTLSRWAQLRGDAENDAGAAQEAMAPLEMLASEGLAVVVCRHARKSGGELGDSARGSNAFGGIADILLGLSELPGQGHTTRRELLARGRFDGITPRLFLELRDGHYVSLGSEADVSSREARQVCLSELPEGREEALTVKDLVRAADGAVSHATLQRALTQLEAEGVVEKAMGAGGARSNAFGYWMCSERINPPRGER